VNCEHCFSTPCIITRLTLDNSFGVMTIMNFMSGPYSVFNVAILLYLVIMIACECPRGFYQPQGTSRVEECQPCPRGTFGLTKDLASPSCSGYCPVGTYNDRLGAISAEDCLKCPPGTWGNTEGLTSRKCSGSCRIGTYSPEWGMNSSKGCLSCPPNYHGWQCDSKY